jgi:hypothetical protein
MFQYTISQLIPTEGNETWELRFIDTNGKWTDNINNSAIFFTAQDAKNYCNLSNIEIEPIMFDNLIEAEKYIIDEHLTYMFFICRISL